MEGGADRAGRRPVSTRAAVAAPGPAEWAKLDLAEGEYQPVAVSGRFENDREIHVV